MGYRKNYREFRKGYELNKNRTIYYNLWDPAKGMLTGKMLVLN